MSDKTPEFIEDDGKPEAETEAPILSAKEVEAIKAEAKAKILAERKSAAKADLLARETQRLKNEEGMVTGLGHQDEIVNITIDLPTFAPSININMRPYWHGHTYPVPRHVAETLRDQMQNCWRHQNQIDAKDLASFYASRRVTEMHKVAKGYVPDPFRPGKVTPAAIAKVA
jgi:hypothetical protein